MIRKRTIIGIAAAGMLLGAGLVTLVFFRDGGFFLSPAPPAQLLPYDRSNPVFYDNDFADDYTDWYLMALASVGDIRYEGISTSSSVAPFNEHVADAPAEAIPGKLVSFDGLLAERSRITEIGARCGLRNVPKPVPGVRGHLLRPASGDPDDTLPIHSPGGSAIRAAALRASPEKPLVVVVGGPMSAVADAYLIDLEEPSTSIADRMIVAAVTNSADGGGFNAWVDPWASYIAMQRLRLVIFPAFPQDGYPRIPKRWIRDHVPAAEARKFLLDLTLDVVNGDDGDVDGMPVVSIMRPDYVGEIRRYRFDRFDDLMGRRIPLMRPDPDGRVISVSRMNGRIATREYKRALANPGAWGAP